MSSNSSYALVTSGGTSVYLDHGRKLTNSAKGAFGAAIANVLFERGIDVVLLCTEQTRSSYPVMNGITVVLYDSYDDYVRKIEEIVADRGKPAFAFSSAAVSDSGLKLETSNEVLSNNEYNVRFSPLPKVIQSWREQFGRNCYMVGYKQHNSGSSLEDLLADARVQNRSSGLNLTVASIKALKPGIGQAHTRIVYLVKPDGGHVTLAGTLSDISNKLVTFVLQQAHTHWLRSERMGTLQEFRTALVKERSLDEAFSFAENLLEVAQEAHLLNGSPGNVVVSDETRKYFLVTPRGVPEKEHLRARDMVCVDRDLSSGVLKYWSDEDGVKPSIDSHVYALIFRNVRNIRAAIHFHEGWVLEAWETRHDFPCGTAEEASMILEGLARSSIRQTREATSPPWIIIELVRHGYMLFLNDHPYAYDTLRNAIADNYEQFALHLLDIGQVLDLNTFRLMPIFGKHGTVIGTVAQHQQEGWCSFFIDEDMRGKRNGSYLVRFINERKISVGVHRDCNVELFYRSYGFSVRERREDGMIILDPPVLAIDLIDVAMVSIRCAQTGKFLQIARTETSIFTKQWSNPAGLVNKDESLWEAAVRIAIELIGFDFNHLPEPDADHQSHFFCSDLAEDDKNDRRMRVIAFQVDVHDEFAPFLDPDHACDFQWRSAAQIRSERISSESTREAARLHEETIRLELRKFDI